MIVLRQVNPTSVSTLFGVPWNIVMSNKSCPQNGITVNGCSTSMGLSTNFRNISASAWKINVWLPPPHSR